MNKRGALELSMNTIIIVVIGVVLLSLGLIFVRGTFSQLTDTSDKVFANANKELDDLGGSVSSALIVSPETVRLKAGQTSGFLIQVTNLEENQIYTGLTGKLSTTDQGINCVFSDGNPTASIRTLVPGAEDRLNVLVRTQKGNIGTKTCKFTLVGLQNPIFDPEVEAMIVIS